MIIDISILLAASFLLFVSTRKLLATFNVIAPNRTLLRCSQMLVLASLALPITLHFVPEKKLPPINFQVFTTGTEKIGEYSMKASTRVKEVSQQVAPALADASKATDWLPLLWALGFAFFLARMLRSFFKLNQLLNRGFSLRSLGYIRVIASDSISVPFSVRFLKLKWVVLPTSILDRKVDCKLALKHELQHHRQGDTMWAVFIEVIQSIFYFNPAIYGWKNIITELQEFSCDEALTGQRGVSVRDYGSCLVRVAETALENRETYVGTTYMAAMFKNPKAFKSLLRRRIEMIMQDQKRARKLAGSFIGIITLLATVAVAYSAEQSSRNKSNSASVDQAIQKIADQVLDRSMKAEGAQAGFAIVADPNTGKVLAVANIDRKNNKKGQWALSQEMEPASLMKGIVAAEAIEQGTTTPTAEHNCEKGNYRYEGRTYHDWKKGGFDKLSTTDTIAISSDICALKIAEKLGSSKLRDMFIRYELGTPEANSRIAPSAAYGMGFKINPMKMVQAYGAIANGGNLLEPQLGSESKKAQVVRRVMSEANSQKMRELLQQVVLNGTGHRAKDSAYSMAGKTESAYTGGVTEAEPTGDKKSDLAGFIGFAPVKNPKIEVYVAIFSPESKDGAHGSTHAVPVFTELTEAVLKHMNVAPDKEKL